MTREEAKEILENAHFFGRSQDDIDTALDMAIKALEQEPCTDAISRREAIKMFKYNYKGERIPDYDCDNFPVQIAIKTVKEMLRGLPPVTPAEKVGRWITQWNMAHQKEYYYCSECREEFSYDGETGIKMNDYSYCPNCGRKMEVENEEA